MIRKIYRSIGTGDHNLTTIPSHIDCILANQINSTRIRQLILIGQKLTAMTFRDKHSKFTLDEKTLEGIVIESRVVAGSPDGTTILTSSADGTIRSFIIPPNLLLSAKTIRLIPYTRHKHPSPINCILVHPSFDLSSPSTTLYLSTPTNLPIRLLNVLSPSSSLVCTYFLTSETTEAFLTPSSLVFQSETKFLTGSDCMIALFDLYRDGSGPIVRLPTIPSKRHRIKGGGVGMRGIVSAIDLKSVNDNLLAAGTWTRWVGLYDSGGLGGTVATWSIAEAADSVAGIGGNGVSQVIWSQCGQYLCVVERASSGVLIFDVRVTGKLVGWLEGREARTNQRLGVNLFQADSGIEVWAGGSDGVVRVWEGVGKGAGAIQKSWEWVAHDDPITSTAVHQSGTVVATSSGQRSFATFRSLNLDENSSDNSFKDNPICSSRQDIICDNSLKIWRL